MSFPWDHLGTLGVQKVLELGMVEGIDQRAKRHFLGGTRPRHSRGSSSGRLRRRRRPDRRARGARGEPRTRARQASRGASGRPRGTGGWASLGAAPAAGRRPCSQTARPGSAPRPPAAWTRPSISVGGRILSTLSARASRSTCQVSNVLVLRDLQPWG